MPLFFVTALKASASAIDAAVTLNFPESSYKIEPGKWIVRADVSTAAKLSAKLGIRETESHLVFPVKGYSGRAQPDLWEWLAAESTRTDG
jgi:hypothetical protein